MASSAPPESSFSQFHENDNSYVHYTWIDTSKLTSAEATSAAREIKLEIENNDENEILLNIYYKPIEMISDPTTCAFLNKFKGDDEAALADLKEAESFVAKARETSLMAPEYLDGIAFVLKCLGNYIHGQMDVVNESLEYGQLEAKSRAAIIAMRLYFVGKLPPKFWDRGAHQKLAERMIEMDPSNSEWHICLYKQFWYQYRDASHNGANKEVLVTKLQSAMEDAFACDSTHPSVFLHYCECLVELSKNYVRNKEWTGELHFAGEVFRSFDELTENIMKKYKKIVELKPSIFAYVKIAMSLFVRLSAHGRKKEHLAFAKECLDHALEQCPTSSFVHHKLGLYSLTIDLDLKKAISYFRQSLEYFPCNFPALADLIQTLMSSPDEHGNEILELVRANVVEDSPWSRPQKGQLMLLEGHTQFMLGNTSEAIACWIQAKEDYEIEWDFTHLQFRYFRYKWPRDRTSLELVRNAVEERKNLEPGISTLDAFLTHLEDEILKVRQYSKSRGSRSSDAGRRLSGQAVSTTPRSSVGSLQGGGGDRQRRNSNRQNHYNSTSTSPAAAANQSNNNNSGGGGAGGRKSSNHEDRQRRNSYRNSISSASPGAGGLQNADNDMDWRRPSLSEI